MQSLQSIQQNLHIQKLLSLQNLKFEMNEYIRISGEDILTTSIDQSELHLIRNSAQKPKISSQLCVQLMVTAVPIIATQVFLCPIHKMDKNLSGLLTGQSLRCCTIQHWTNYFPSLQHVNLKSKHSL